MSSRKSKAAIARPAPVLEVLEARVLFSADALGSLLPMLLPEEPLEEDGISSDVFGSYRMAIDDGPLTAASLHSIEFHDIVPAPTDHALPSDTPLLLSSGSVDRVEAQVSGVRHLVFVDSAVEENERLTSGINTDTSRVCQISKGDDALALITQTLAGYSGLDSVQILSHGSSGQLMLGGKLIDHASLLEGQDGIRDWSAALAAEADILLLGCDVATGVQGEAFVDLLSELTGADVAASDDPTGHASLAADWQMEYATGSIEADIAVDGLIQSQWAHTMAAGAAHDTITVDTIEDKFDIPLHTTLSDLLAMQADPLNPHPVSLREAVHAAQNGPTAEEIILLPAGVYTLDRPWAGGSFTNENGGDLDISENTRIQGESSATTIIRQDLQSRVIQVNSGSLTLEQVTISDGHTSDSRGGGVSSEGTSTLAIRDSVISGNVANQGGGGVYAGGASFTIANTVFENNQSQADSGGGLYAATVGTVDNSLFTGNESFRNGAGLYASAEISVSSSLFEVNSAFFEGGAVYNAAGTMTISDSGFAGNTADHHGGALSARDTVFINRSSFFDNTSNVDHNGGGRGGAIYHSTNGTLEVVNSTFANNSSELSAGGAIFAARGGFVQHSTFVDNVAGALGSAIFALSSPLQLGNSIIVTSSETAGAGATVASNYSISGEVQSTGLNLFDHSPDSLHQTDLVTTAVLLDAVPTTVGNVSAYPLMERSPAINAGSFAGLGTDLTTQPTDSQGFLRDEAPDSGASEFDSDTSIVFWTDDTGGIYRSDPYFLNVQQIAQAGADATAIAVDIADSRLYWLESSNTRLMSVGLDFVTQTKLTNLAGATSLAIDSAASHLYIAFSGNTPRIERYDLDTLDLQLSIVPEVLENPVDIVFNPLTDSLFILETTDNGTRHRMQSVNSLGENLLPRQEMDNLDPGALGAGDWVPFSRAIDDLGRLDPGSGTLTQSVLGSPGSTINYEDGNELLIVEFSDDKRLISLFGQAESFAGTYLSANQITSVATTPTSTISAKPAVNLPIVLDVLEGGRLQIDGSILSSEDQDTPPEQRQYSITAPPANGQFGTLSLSHNNATLESIENFTPVNGFTQSSLDELVYVYQHDGSETNSDLMELRLSDSVHGTNRFSVTLNIIPVNDAPSLDLLRTSATIEEGGRYVFNVADFHVSDADNEVSDLLFGFRSLPVSGTIEVNDRILGQADTFTFQELTENKVLFRHGGGDQLQESIQFFVSDGEAEVNTPAAFEFTIEPINDPPVLTTRAQPVLVEEGGDYTLSVDDLQVSDPDSSLAQLVYRQTSDMEVGALLLNNVVLGSGAVFTQQDLESGHLVYRHAGGEQSLVSIDFEVSDGVGFSSRVTLELEVNSVNDSPTLVTLPVEMREGDNYVLQPSDIVAADVDSDVSLFAYRYTSALTAGTIEVDGVPLSLNAVFTHQQLTDGLVVYRHDGSESLTELVELVVDDGQLRSLPAVLDITVTAVNDVPILQVDASAVAENLAGAVVAQLTGTDADPGDTVTFSVDDARFSTDTGMLVLKPGYTLDFESEPQVILTVTATDSSGASVSEELVLVVENRNDAPEVVLALEPVLGDGYRLPDELAMDQDGDALSYEARLPGGDALPSWLRFDAELQAFTVIDTSAVVPELVVEVVIDDGRGGMVSDLLTLQFDPELAAAEVVAPVVTPVVTPAVTTASVVISKNTSLEQLVSRQPDSGTAQEPETQSESVASDKVPDNSGAEKTGIDDAKGSTDRDGAGNASILYVDDFEGFHETVDLHDLIAPVHKAGSLELARIDDEMQNLTPEDLANASLVEMDVFRLEDLLQLPASEFASASSNLARAMDQQEEQMKNPLTFTTSAVGTSAGISTGLSVGYLIWLIRGGTLMGSVLSALPAWRFVDPLPVLGSLTNDVDEDDESLASMVDAENEATDQDEARANEDCNDLRAA